MVNAIMVYTQLPSSDLSSSPSHNSLVAQVQKLVSPAYIPGRSNEITGFVLLHKRMLLSGFGQWFESGS